MNDSDNAFNSQATRTLTQREAAGKGYGQARETTTKSYSYPPSSAQQTVRNIKIKIDVEQMKKAVKE